MAFGWTTEYILAMNAKAFFTIIESSRRLKFREHNRTMFDMCFVNGVSTSQDQQWINRTIDTFKSNAFPVTTKKIEPEVKMSMDQIVDVMRNVESQMRRVPNVR